MILLYGATGYTGTLIAEECARRSLAVTLCGRSAAALKPLAERLRQPFVTAALDDNAALDRALAPAAVVLHCAGPFSRTARPMVDACVRNGKHYLDITGELDIFEALARRSDEAAAKGVMLLPGAGFDVVPSDCLAAHMKRRMPNAVKLRLCIASVGRLSHGTATTVLEHIAHGGAVRKNGVLVRERAAARERVFDVGDGKSRRAVSMPWGDVVTAWSSTQIPDIEVYFALGKRTRGLLRGLPLVAPLLRVNRVKRFAQSFIPEGGPSSDQRARGKSIIVGEAEDASGHVVTSRFTGPEGYDVTVHTALLIAARVVAGDCKPGFQTPATAYGPDLILEVAGTRRVDS